MTEHNLKTTRIEIAGQPITSYADSGEVEHTPPDRIKLELRQTIAYSGHNNFTIEYAHQSPSLNVNVNSVHEYGTPERDEGWQIQIAVEVKTSSGHPFKSTLKGRLTAEPKPEDIHKGVAFCLKAIHNQAVELAHAVQSIDVIYPTQEDTP